MDSTILKMIIALRHQLHRNPELSMCEHNTIRVIRLFLEEHTHLEIHDMGSWLYAVRKAAPGSPAIAFRADMDALPMDESLNLPYSSQTAGVSHKCGHDGHTAVLCGLALELDRIRSSRTIYLIFQPGEETGEGAAACRHLIREKGISEIYAFHNLPGYPENNVVFRRGLTQPASEGIRFFFRGKPSHASAPEQGHNPSEAIARIILYAKELAGAPRPDHPGMVLCTVTGICSGTGDFGISPGEGTLSLTIRAEDEEVMKQMEKDLISFSQRIGKENELHVSWEIRDYFPETRNHDKCLEKVIANARSLGLTCYEMNELWRASEDFGHYLKECPGAMYYIGAGTSWPALHTPAYDFNDRITETAVDLFLSLADPRSHLVDD